MKKRRGSSSLRTEMARMLEQFKPGDRVVPLFVNSPNDGIQGVVTEVNTVEGKVYVAWNGGPVKQHDPDEVMVQVHMYQDPDRNIQEDSKELIRENPTSEDANINNDTENLMNIPGIKERIIKSSELKGRRMAGKFEKAAEEESIYKYDPKHESKPEKGQWDKTDKGWARKVAVYHGQRGRMYRRTRRERTEDTIFCPRCKPEMTNLELHPFVRGVGLWICPKCGWKITTDKVVD